MSKQPHIIAFYSFRGGVGRTTALCNVAARLIKQGDRVLVIDMDLQAPGASVLLGGANFTTSPGLVEAIVEARTENRALDLKRAIRKMKLGTQTFWLLPAGQLDSSYPERLERADPTEWLATNEAQGIKFFEDLRKIILSATERWHYVLVDCRPGLTRPGAIAVRLLADSIVFLFGLSRQSRAGINWVRKSLRIEDKVLHLVATHVVDGDSMKEAVEEARRAWQEPIQVMLHFDLKMLLNERVLMTPADNQLVRDYDTLTEVVRTSGDVYSLIQQGKALLLEPGQVAQAHKKFQEAYAADNIDPRALTAMANFYLVHSEYPRCLEFLERAAEYAPEDPDLWQVADGLSEKIPDELSGRLEALYAKAAGTSASRVRVALAKFSVQIREALKSDPENAKKDITNALLVAAQVAGSDGKTWLEIVRRIPLPPITGEERESLPNWIRFAAEGGAALQPLVVILKERLASSCKDLSGVVTRFGYRGFGFLATDDGQDDIYFTRRDCRDYGADETDYIALGEAATFDVVYEEEGKWNAKNVAFPALAGQD